MTNLYLIRHGKYVGETNGKTADLGLSALGRKQTELLRDRLAASGEIEADILISSTLRRARETAEILAPAFKLPVIFDADVEEWHNIDDGVMTGEQFGSMWNAVPHEERPYFRWMEGKENWLEFSLRATSALHRLLHEHEGKTIVLVCHGGIIDSSFAYCFGMNVQNFLRAAPDAGYTSITHWKRILREGRPPLWVLKRFNDTHHLSNLSTLAEVPTPTQEEVNEAAPAAPIAEP